MERRLAAIMALDVVDFSRLMGKNEAGTLTRLKAIRAELVQPLIEQRNGRIVKLLGDGLLAEFPSAVEAVDCAVSIQSGMDGHTDGTDDTDRIALRIGVNAGDIIGDGKDIYGDGVNIAARLEAIAVPGGVCISGSVFEAVENKLDYAFSDLGEQSLKNIDKPVQVYAFEPEGSSPATQFSGPLALPEKPSIAVLPFDNMSGDPEQDYFADGVTEDIITGLSRNRNFFVIARNSTFTYKNQPINVKTVGRDLGVRYVLEGSIRRSGNRIRVTAQLIEAENGNHVWAQKYDRELEDIFIVQDEITEAIVASIEPELGSAERERAVRAKRENLDVWGLYQRGLWHIYKFTPDNNARALELFLQAADKDGKFGPALAGASFAYFVNVYLEYSDNREAELQLCLETASRAILCDDKDAASHWALARGYLLSGEHELAIAEFEKAIELNPSYAQAYYNLGWALVQAGRPNEAMEHLDRAYRLSPNDPLMFAFMNVRALGLALMGEFEKAYDWSQRATLQQNTHFHTWAIATLCAALAGRSDEMAKASRQLLNERPDYTCALFERSYPFKHSKDLDLMLRGLRKAGIP